MLRSCGARGNPEISQQKAGFDKLLHAARCLQLPD
jgi:hypothetical protein